MTILLIYIGLLCGFSFILMGIDKYKAINNYFRIPESTFIKLSLLGGSLGTYLGMYVFKHKTLHKKFYLGIPIILFLNILIFLLLLIFH